MTRLIEVTYTVKAIVRPDDDAKDDADAERMAMDEVAEDPGCWVDCDNDNVTVSTRWVDA